MCSRLALELAAGRECGKGRVIGDDFEPKKIVFAILLKDGEDLTPDTLFPFSQVTLASAARILQAQGTYRSAPVGVAPSFGCYTLAMPTTRPRHVITETEQIARALDDAARRWPADGGNRAKLLAHLVEEGHRAVISQLERDASARRDGVTRTSGVLTGAYGDGYLAELREDWPE